MKPLKGEAQERSGLKDGREGRGEQAAERVETLRAERSGGWKPRASGPAGPAGAEGQETP